MSELNEFLSVSMFSPRAKSTSKGGVDRRSKSPRKESDSRSGRSETEKSPKGVKSSRHEKSRGSSEEKSKSAFSKLRLSKKKDKKISSGKLARRQSSEALLQSAGLTGLSRATISLNSTLNEEDSETDYGDIEEDFSRAMARRKPGSSGSKSQYVSSPIPYQLGFCLTL